MNIILSSSSLIIVSSSSSKSNAGRSGREESEAEVKMMVERNRQGWGPDGRLMARCPKVAGAAWASSRAGTG